jgi:CheY-like chemotaxis protein
VVRAVDELSISRMINGRSFAWQKEPTRENKMMPATSEIMAEKYRILIVDDNQANCELLDAYLAEVDCEIAFAADGKEALAMVATFRPDLILLDVMMPKLSGFEVCQRIKQDPALQHIMVLMVTALNELGDIERAVDAGTNDFLSKPINKLELLKRVENLLKLKDVTDENERLRRYIEGMEDDRNPPGSDNEGNDNQGGSDQGDDKKNGNN